MDEQARAILAGLGAGKIPSRIPPDSEYAPELQALCDYHRAVLSFANAIATGDLSAELKFHGGPLIGSLKSLHASLRHLTWQTKQIAQGDLTQRVDFMGEFSDAFNSMVERLDAARRELIHMSTHDVMTGLYNRAYFDAELNRVAKGRSFPVSIIMADLDGLKGINDNVGHEAGDRLIRGAAEILRASFRGDDVVARIGGDEFAVIMAGCPADSVQVALNRIRTQQAEFNSTTGATVSISIGSGTADTREQIAGAIKIADEEMYRDKARNKACRT